MSRSTAFLLAAFVFAAFSVPAASQDGTKPGPEKAGVAPMPVPPKPPAPGGPAPKFQCAKPTFDFGEVSQGEEVVHDFEVENAGQVELDLINIHGSCGCTHAAAEKTKLQPGEKTKINGKINTAGKQGPTQITISVTTNDPTNPNASLLLTGRIAQPFRPAVTELNFGTLRKGSAVDQKTFDILTSSAQTITDIKTDNDLVKASYENIPAEEKKLGYRVAVKIDGPLPVGQLRSLISIGTSVPAQKTISIPVLALVEGEVNVTPRTFNFGKTNKKDAATKTVEIRKAGKSDLKIEKLEVKPEGAFTAKLEEVKPGESYRIVLGVAPEAKDGYSRGTVLIKTNCPGETDLQVYFYALIQ